MLGGGDGDIELDTTFIVCRCVSSVVISAKTALVVVITLYRVGTRTVWIAVREETRGRSQRYTGGEEADDVEIRLVGHIGHVVDERGSVGVWSGLKGTVEDQDPCLEGFRGCGGPCRALSKLWYTAYRNA